MNTTTEESTAKNELSLSYYNAKGEEKAIPIKLRFLSPELRTEIIKFDSELQKAHKALQQEEDTKKTVEYGKATKAKFDEMVADYISKNPDATEAEIDMQKQIISSDLTSDEPDESIDINQIAMSRIWAFNYEQASNFFKKIINFFALEKAHAELIKSDWGSDFWRNCNINQVMEINAFFRRTNNI